AQRDLEEKTCKHDQEEFALLQAASPTKERMAEFQKKLGCETLRPAVVAALSKFDAPAPTAADEARTLVRDTQIALRKVGCFKGADNGELNDATKAAIKQFLTHSDRDEAEANPSADLLKEIKAAPADTCPLTCAAGQVARGGTCVAERPAKPPVRAERERARP